MVLRQSYQTAATTNTSKGQTTNEAHSDCSPDNGYEVAVAAAERIGRGRVKVFRNDVNRGAVYNHVSTIRAHCGSEDIIMLIDGDDSLVANSQIFQKYNNLYDGTTEFTYGSCWSMVDNIPLVAQPYPEKVKQDRSYRDYRFNWNMPYTTSFMLKQHLFHHFLLINLLTMFGGYHRP